MRDDLVYEHGDTGALGICSLTKPLPLAKSDIDKLGKGKLLIEKEAVEELEKHHLSPYVAVICAISFVMFADYLEKRLQKQ
ncbi:hypothetical protein [Thermaerobacillus caldiproteolyticus]|uniref:hypothetical protein n=1 Tax=Thermaerobacillus caldiproteolyticus TaxID=247480 RepID=UPI0018F1F8E1|nr:hypothetical protein [Anoxybacillus caldiproteolyticus]